MLRRLSWPHLTDDERAGTSPRSTQYIGYEPCETAALEPGFEKVAIYADEFGEPTHAARQLPSGRWTSKMGDLEDIEHADIHAVEGPLYGRAVAFLKRVRP